MRTRHSLRGRVQQCPGSKHLEHHMHYWRCLVHRVNGAQLVVRALCVGGPL